MQRASARKLCQAVLLAGGVTLAVSAITEAAVPPLSGDISPAAVVLRGSAVSAAEAPPVSDGDPPTVLRGSLPSSPRSHAMPSVCPAGLDYDANYGCVSPGYAYTPDYGYWPEYGYWPYLGFGQVDNGRRGLHRAFIHPGRRALAPHFGRRTITGFTHMGGFAHAGGFGHR